jgi:SAM-dependent methyltransferase
MPQDADGYGIVSSRYYDAVYESLRGGSGDIEFYRRLARESGGPVLELGCGTGRVLLPIARDGIACVGLDQSAGMSEVVRRKNPPPNLRVALGRMQSFDLGGERFRLIFSAFRSFQHLYTVEDQLACLTRVRRHLAPDAVFAFDVFAPNLERIAQAEEPETEEARFFEDDLEIVRYTAVRRDHANQLMRLTMRYERRRNGAAIGNDVVEFRMRYFFRFELEHLLARAGFDEVRIFGGFDERPYDYTSGETVVVARAAESDER